MSLNSQELADVLVELSACLHIARLRRLNAPRETVCQLVLRADGQDRVLLVDLTPGATRLHLIRKKLPALPTPPAWVMKCRREIEGQVLQGIEQASDDRVVRFRFGGGKRPARVLLAALFGRTGRLTLLDDSELVVHPLLGGGTPGEPVELPAARPGMRPKTRFPAPDPESNICNRAVEAHYEEFLARGQEEEVRRTLERHLSRELKRLRRRIGKMEADLARTSEGEELARQAEALKANLHRLHKGEELVTLQDPGCPDGGNIEVRLEPSLSPVENMQRLFARSRRLAAARPRITSRLTVARTELDELHEQAAVLGGARGLTALQAVEERWKQSGFLRRAKPSKARRGHRLPYRRFHSASGKPILVGRSGRDNHELTFRVARGSDLWMHARNRPGAHVVVRLDRDEEIDPQTLTDAATMAAHAAGAKPGDKVEVSYTRAKHVHPVKGAAAGRVSVAKGRTILVQIDAERLSRIQKTFEK